MNKNHCRRAACLRHVSQTALVFVALACGCGGDTRRGGPTVSLNHDDTRPVSEKASEDGKKVGGRQVRVAAIQMLPTTGDPKANVERANQIGRAHV